MTCFVSWFVIACHGKIEAIAISKFKVMPSEMCSDFFGKQSHIFLAMPPTLKCDYATIFNIIPKDKENRKQKKY